MIARTFRRAAVLGALLMGLAGAASAEECHGVQTPAKLTVIVDNVRTTHGLLAVTIYQEKGFLKKGGGLKVWRDPARAGVQSMCMYLPAPGTYAIAVFQDMDSDHKFNHTLWQPTEPWGFSNNPHALLNLPRFSQVKFPVPAGETTIHVRLSYP